MQDSIIKKYRINLEAGVHVRTAMTIIKLVGKYKSAVIIEKDGRSADADSPLSILTLGIALGDEIKVEFTGVDSLALAEEFDKLAENNFGE